MMITNKEKSIRGNTKIKWKYNMEDCPIGRPVFLFDENMSTIFVGTILTEDGYKCKGTCISNNKEKFDKAVFSAWAECEK